MGMEAGVMGELWYRLEDCIPQLKVKVRVLSQGVVFEAMRWQRKSKKKHHIIHWVTISGNVVKWLKHEPEAWQPLYPELFQGPLVNPFRLGEPPKIHPPLEPREREWWRDDGSVRYSLPGSITPREAEGRVMRALWAETSFHRADTVYSPTPLTWLAKMIEMAEMAAGKRATYWHDRFQPTGADIKDFMNIIPWLRSLTERQYTIIRMRAEQPAFSLAEIALRLDVSSTTVANTYRKAILELTTAANAQSIKPTTHAARRSHDKQAGVSSYASAD